MSVEATRRSRLLLRWYDAHARLLPWRAPPGAPPPADRDWPYRVWLSEVMLQQTTVAAVIGYFNAFTARWPTVEALAAAPDADVMAAWAGLGYYARARNLLACARAVVANHGGRFPDTEAGLRALPGIGAYTAAAIAAIAFDRLAVVVDGNVERVVARLHADATPLPSAKPRFYAYAAAMTPNQRAGDHAQAMMDLGATVCTPRSPVCGICPLSDDCAGYASGDPSRLPVKAAKLAKPVRYGTIYWLVADGAVLTVHRPAHGLLGGMRALPTDEWAADAPAFAPPVAAEWHQLDGTVTHVFTHFELRLTIAAAVLAYRPAIDGEWVPLGAIADAGLPTVFGKAARAALANAPRHAVCGQLNLESAP
jgi:A/G-specific adenine glycosylase